MELAGESHCGLGRIDIQLMPGCKWAFPALPVLTYEHTLHCGSRKTAIFAPA